MKFELSQEDSDLLTLVLGYASGVAHSRGELDLFRRIIGLANTIHQGRPDWTPYEIPDPVEQ